MPSPAVHIDSALQVDGRFRYCSQPVVGGPFICEPSEIYDGDSVAAVTQRDRPKSVGMKKTASGWRNPTNWSHSGVSWHFVAVPAFTSGTGTRWYHEYYDNAGWGKRFWALPPFPSKMEDAAVNKALSRLKGINGGPNLSVAFGERKEAAGMMADRVTSIARSVSRFRRARPKDWGQVIRNGTRNELRNIPGSWLELQYGWKPLMSDVHSACQALNKRESDQDAYRAHVKGVVIEQRPVRAKVSSTVSANFYVDLSLQYSVVSVCDLSYELNNPFIQSLASLGITNPLELAWELVPYSFVIDWFLPVGNYLSLLDADFGWSFKSGTLTRFQKANGEGPVLCSRPNTVSGVRSGSASQRSYRMSRVVLTSSPWPRIPHLKNPLSSGHIANAMSLLVQAFK